MFAAHRATHVCMEQLRGCMRGAAAASSRASALAGNAQQYLDYLQWPLTSMAEQHAVPPGTCECVAAALTCVGHNECAAETQLAYAQLRVLGIVTAGCVDTTAALLASLPPVVNATAWNASTLSLSATLAPLDGSSGGAPTANGTSGWSASSFDSSADEVRLSVWSAPAFLATSTLLLSVSSSAAVTAVVTAAPLDSFPIVTSGTATAATGIAASVIRAGGATLTITLLCDQFLPSASGATIAAGLLSTSSSLFGWDAVVLPGLGAAQLTLSANLSAATLTLPAVPEFYPTANDRSGCRCQVTCSRQAPRPCFPRGASSSSLTRLTAGSRHGAAGRRAPRPRAAFLAPSCAVAQRHRRGWAAGRHAQS
jgi:hypothetical protein